MNKTKLFLGLPLVALALLVLGWRHYRPAVRVIPPGAHFQMEAQNWRPAGSARVFNYTDQPETVPGGYIRQSIGNFTVGTTATSIVLPPHTNTYLEIADVYRHYLGKNADGSAYDFRVPDNVTIRMHVPEPTSGTWTRKQ